MTDDDIARLILRDELIVQGIIDLGPPPGGVDMKVREYVDPAALTEIVERAETISRKATIVPAKWH